MGCKGSKEEKDEKKIDSTFETIQMPRFDDFFRTARDLLENAEKIRSGLEDNKERGVELSHTHKLKDPKYVDVIQILFWTLSAQAGGKITDTGVTVGTEIPFIKLDPKKVSTESNELYQTFAEYIKTVVEGPKTLKEIVEQLTELSRKCPDLVKEGKTEIQNSSLDLSGKAQAIARLGKNGTKLPKELAKCQKLQEILQQTNTDLRELAPKFKELFTAADETGAKAAAEGLKLPGEIFEKYHTGPRADEKTGDKKEEKGEKKEKKEKKDKKDKDEKKDKKDGDEKKDKKDKDEKKDKKDKKDKDEKKEDKKDEKKEEKHEEKHEETTQHHQQEQVEEINE